MKTYDNFIALFFPNRVAKVFTCSILSIFISLISKGIVKPMKKKTEELQINKAEVEETLKFSNGIAIHKNVQVIAISAILI
jgi:hypothetical protein